MKKLFIILLSVFASQSNGSQLQAEPFTWKTDYKEGALLAKQQSKPMVLFFTGSDWCSWCAKLEEETFNDKDFQTAVSDQFIFIKLDFPMKTKQSEEMIKQNKELQQTYDVKSFPSVVLLTPEEKEIGVTGYRPGGGKQYAEHLLKMVNEYENYEKNRKDLENKALSGTELKVLYRKAKEFQRVNDQIAIVKKGMKSDRPHYFMIERYRHLANIGMVREREAVTIRKKLLDSDPENRYLTHYQVACIDFDAYADEMNAGITSPEDAVTPLVDYIKQYGAQDAENIWRIEMIVSQVYNDCRECDKALHYAKEAYQKAPDHTKGDIAMTIELIKSQRKAG